MAVGKIRRRDQHRDDESHRADWNAGFVVETGDVEEFAAEIVGLAQDPERTEALGENARSTVESRNNWVRDGGCLRDVYDELSWEARSDDQSVSATRGKDAEPSSTVLRRGHPRTDL